MLCVFMNEYSCKFREKYSMGESNVFHNIFSIKFSVAWWCTVRVVRNGNLKFFVIFQTTRGTVFNLIIRDVQTLFCISSCSSYGLKFCWAQTTTTHVICIYLYYIVYCTAASFENNHF